MEINWKKNTALFLIGQALSFFGTMVVQYALVWHITLESWSGTMITLFTVAGFLPMFFISPFAGVWADRFNRKYVINIADGSIAFVSLIVAVCLMAGIKSTESYGLLLLCALMRSLGQGVQMPAVGAFLPQIVPPDQLTRINGFQGSIQSLVTLSAPMVSGALMTFAPLQTLFFLDVVTAAIGISIVLFWVKVPPVTLVSDIDQAPEARPEQVPETQAEQAPPKGAAYFHDLKEGLRYIRKHGYVLRMIVLSAVFLFFFAPAALLTPLQVTRNFGSDVWRLSAIEITFSVGMMLGGIFIGVWGGFKNRIYTMALSCALCGILAAGLGIAPNFWLYLAIMAVMGVLLPLWNAPSMVLLQTTVEPAFMGRVLSVFTMVSSTMMPLGMVVFGPAADIVSIDTLLIGTGIVVTLLAIPLVTSKTMRKAGAAPAGN
ncbi:MAG: MFS transporter [Spirochaetaceae bacterium]|jgi:DHA3 family macrolide efflux protein-like MFS transporter|nr:MFS transporter [Spirochaetaceae bacterium]